MNLHCFLLYKLTRSFIKVLYWAWDGFMRFYNQGLCLAGVGDTDTTMSENFDLDGTRLFMGSR